MIEQLLSALAAASVGLLAGMLVRTKRGARGEVLEERNARELPNDAADADEDLEQGDTTEPVAHNTGFVGPAHGSVVTGFSEEPLQQAGAAARAMDTGRVERSTEINWVPDEPPLPPLPPGNPKLQRASVDELGGVGGGASDEGPAAGDGVLWSGRTPAYSE